MIRTQRSGHAGRGFFGVALWLVCGVCVAGINEWTAVSPSDEPVGLFAIDPRNPARLYAGTFDPTLTGREVGILRSDDRGQTWLFASLGGIGVTGVAVDPADSSVVYAATFFGGLFRSDDFGATWNVTRPAGSLEQPKSFALDPSNPGTLYVAVGHLPLVLTGDSICRSSDRARSYDRCYGFPNGSKVASITVDPAVSSRAYASVDGRLWTTADGGSQWTMLTNLPPGGYANVGITRTVSPTIYTDGLLRSSDAGLTWLSLGTPPLGPGFILPDPTGQTIFVGGQGGISRSLDGGSTWSSITRGFPAARAGPLAFDPLDSDTIYATGAGVLYRITLTDRDSSCSIDAHTLCLHDGRFQVTLSWTTGDVQGSGNALPLTGDTGAFWFFSSNNIELAVKVVDGRALNGRFWVFGAGLTDVAYELTVTDVKRGFTWTHLAQTGRLESYADTNAFDP